MTRAASVFIAHGGGRDAVAAVAAQFRVGCGCYGTDVARGGAA